MTWSEEDDRRLWSARSRPKSQLASTFGRSIGAIRSRLKHLQDPTHKACRRRVGGASAAAAASRSSGLRELVSSHRSASRSISRSSHGMLGMSSFASSYAAAKKSSGAGSRPKSNVIDLTGASPFAGNNAASKWPSPQSDAELYTQMFPPSESSPPPSSVTSIANAHLKPSSPSVESVSSQHEQKEKPINSSSLNSDQRAASDYIFSGGNAFLTGAAGVGKSYLLRHLIQGLRSKHEGLTNLGGSLYVPTSREPAVAVTATTGIAATHINGVTIHSWAGVQLGQGGARVLVPRVMRNAAACRRWRAAKVLVLDEVSMIDGMFFEALDAIGREVRRSSAPFGGIQLVLSGDFFQLPPVSLGRCGFAFECPAWSAAGVRMVELTTVVRQQGDRTFVDLLGEIRLGRCPEGLTRALESCHVSRKAPPVDGIVPTKLYCTNRNVDEENNRKLVQLPGKEQRFRASDEFKGKYSKQVESGLTQTMDKKVPSELRLKEGAQVILTRNMPEHKLVNGSRGIVKSFEEERKNDDGSHYAISGSGNSKKRYPVVHFSNGVRMMVREESGFQGGASGGMTRRQLPLKLGWSLTVHKSQGMTIERAELQLDDAFDFGQVYVALSRVTSLSGLWVRGGRVTQSVVKAHPKVLAFYQRNGSSLLASG